MKANHELLRAVGIFADVPDGFLAELAEAATPRTLEPGETLIREGEIGRHLHVVAEGRLQVVRTDPNGHAGEVATHGADVLLGRSGSQVHLGDVLPGECVGEVALLRDTRRTATVEAIERTVVLDIPGKVFRLLLRADPACEAAVAAQVEHRMSWESTRLHRPSAEEVIEQLARMLPGTPVELLESLEPQLQWVPLPRGTVLMRHGHPGDHMYFVVSGRLEAYVTRDDGSRLLLGDVGPGESVGEMALLANEPRTASVEVAADCELLRLSKQGFDQLITSDPAASATVARMMADRLQERLRARTFVAQLRTVPSFTLEDCEDVVSSEHLVLRNLKVTEGYYRLSVGMTLLLGHQDTSWLTFACNASKTVGSFIRGDAVPLSQTVEWLRQAPGLGTILSIADRAITSAPVAGAFRARLVAAIDDVADLISQGNIKVFSELAPVFTQLIAAYHDRRDYDRAVFEQFLDGLGLRTGPSEPGGQDTLREALIAYHEAMFQPDPKRKAELILLANFKTGLHEQIRLQPQIEGAMNAPLSEDLFEGLPLGPLEAVIREPVMRAWRHFATRTMMRYRLPYGAISVSGDLPVLPTRQPYPDVLSTLENRELQGVVAEYGRHRGARWFLSRDWANLHQRMTFILELFRTRQKSLELFDPPFLHQQRVAIAADMVPAGSL